MVFVLAGASALVLAQKGKRAEPGTVLIEVEGAGPSMQLTRLRRHCWTSFRALTPRLAILWMLDILQTVHASAARATICRE